MAIGVSLMSHGFQDAVSLELARRIAGGLPQHPEWLSVARANLDRWASQNRDAPSLLQCYEEWRELLDHPVEEICAALTAETENSQRIRQNSPFAGVLPPAEVWEIKARFRHATPAAWPIARSWVQLTSTHFPMRSTRRPESARENQTCLAIPMISVSGRAPNCRES